MFGVRMSSSTTCSSWRPEILTATLVGPSPTGRLEVATLPGKLPAVLEQRTDLAPALIKTVVRHGLYGMPITRKTEVNDAELEDVVAYLTRNRKK